jgi:chorismate mutase
MAVRALRGATKLSKDDAVEMREAVVELLQELFQRNRVEPSDLISILFTATPDLRCGFPAAAARELPLGDVPLMCASELDIEGALPLVVRVLVHTETQRPRAELSHVYLRGAEVLRLDLAQ